MTSPSAVTGGVTNDVVNAAIDAFCNGPVPDIAWWYSQGGMNAMRRALEAALSAQPAKGGAGHGELFYNALVNIANLDSGTTTLAMAQHIALETLRREAMLSATHADEGGNLTGF